MIRNKYSAVLFDLDGTLLDTLDDLAGTMNAVLKKHGFPEHEPESYKLFVGEGVETLVKRSLPVRRGADIPALVMEMKKEYDTGWARKTRPYDGIADMLNELRRYNVSLAVLSNKPDEFTKVMVTRFFPDTQFHAVLGARKGFPLKPDPAGALEICKNIGLKPDQFVYLGDSGTDMLTAVKAGMFPVGALWGFRDEKELLENGAKRLISKPEELIELF